jgi:hypothetical protein
VNGKEYHHFFPQDYLKQKAESKHRINCLSNIVLLTSASNKVISNRAPSDYLEDVAANLGSKLDQHLAAHFIDHGAYEAALRDDFSGFLQARSRMIHKAVLKLANWE